MIRHLDHSRLGQIVLGAMLALIACSATLEAAVRAVAA